MTRKAVRFERPDGEVSLGRLEGETIVESGPAPEMGFTATPLAWEQIGAAAGARFSLATVRLLAPVCPPVVLCVGLNYTDHIAEAGMDTPDHPVVFAKLGSAVIGPEDPIIIPDSESQTDWEAEMAIVIGTKVKDADDESARRAIGGVTALNDVSGRFAQLTTGGGQYVRGKSFDTFAPLGPAIVHPDDLDIDDLRVRLLLNGEVQQDSSTRHLLFDPVAIVRWLSTATTLTPGTVIATGTPGGVGFSRDPQRFLIPGDLVEVHVEGVGVLRNAVVSG